MPDSSCMGDESRIQNVPSLADVKSRKMAHYWDRKGARWSNRPHVGLKRNDKGRDRGRWHRNILIFQLLLNLDFKRTTQITMRGLKRKFPSWIILSTAHCVRLLSDNAGWGQGYSRANPFPSLHLRLNFIMLLWSRATHEHAWLIPLVMQKCVQRSGEKDWNTAEELEKKRKIKRDEEEKET